VVRKFPFSPQWKLHVDFERSLNIARFFTRGGRVCCAAFAFFSPGSFYSSVSVYLLRAILSAFVSLLCDPAPAASPPRKPPDIPTATQSQPQPRPCPAFAEGRPKPKARPQSGPGQGHSQIAGRPGKRSALSRNHSGGR
jgi:hypothetical protein